MICERLWHQDILRIGDSLAAEYIGSLDKLGLLDVARERSHRGEAGGEGAEQADRHFALQFANSAGRAVYVYIDALERLADLSTIVQRYFSGGRVLLIEIPCGSGAGSLGLLSAILEQRNSRFAPTLPLHVDILAGDVSVRGMTHFESLLQNLRAKLSASEIHVVSQTLRWDASDIRSSSKFIDQAVATAADCDQIFLLVSNFSDALADGALASSFEHFLSQFAGRASDTPHCICWVEPVSNKGERAQSSFRKFFERMTRWLASTIPSDSGVRYMLLDPIRQEPVRSGVRVLRSQQSGMP